MDAAPGTVGRRGFILSILAVALPAGPPLADEAQRIYVISRKRLLTEAVPPRLLRRAEAQVMARLQQQIDAIKDQLAAEESELTRLRDELSPEDMDARASDFDRRVRAARRQAQERASAVQTAFQEARAALVEELPVIVETLRVEVGAIAILDADQALAIDPAHDLTERAIALFSERMPAPQIPTVDVELSLPEQAGPDGQSATDQ